MSEHRSWSAAPRPGDDAARAAESRRQRRRRWVRVGSIGVVLAVVVVDIVALIVTAVVQNELRGDRSCATFWSDLSHEAGSGIWTTLVVLGVVLLLFLWRPWIAVAAVVVQLLAVAILLPPQFHDRAYYADVAAGRIPVADADSGGLACS